MSEPVDDGQPEGSGQPRTSDQRGSGGQPRTNGQPGGRGQSRKVNDPIADFQRWLMRAGARSMANQVADQVRRTVGQERRARGDVWDTATNELPPDEPPECQWCPVCQAARAARLSGPGLMSSVADVGGALASMAQDAFSAFEQIMKAQDQNRSTERTGVKPPSPKPDSLKPDSLKPDSLKPDSLKPDSLKPDSLKPDSGDSGQ